MIVNLPPIHQAIVQNDLSTLQQLLVDSPQFSQDTDPWGFSPFEIAQLLGKREALRLLAPGPETPIRLLPRGEANERFCSEKEFTQITGVQYTPTLFFQTYESLVEVIRHCPWYLRKTALGRESRWLGKLYKPEIADGSVADVTIRWIDEEIGYGLFTNQALATTDFVVEYTGLVRRRHWSSSEKTEYCFRYPSRFFSTHSYVIDAQVQGNYSRFMNHSDRPNCIPCCALYKGLLHILFRAKHPIPEGTQLTIDYGRWYWKKRVKRSL